MSNLNFNIGTEKGDRVYIIAEVGVNHNGQMDMAFELIENAADAGVDAIKFQTFIPEELASPTAAKATYQSLNTNAEENQLEMLKKLTIPFAEFINLKQFTNERGLDFLSTPFDLPSYRFLSDELNCAVIKIGSGDLTNLPLIYEIGLKKQKVIISTGMSNMQEIDDCLNAYRAGFRQETKPDFFNNEFYDIAGRVILLHCVSQYPAPIEQLNLRVIPNLIDKYPFPIGYSDHSIGVEASIASIALGARVIEKHITLDNNLEGPDHKASLETKDLKNFTSSLRKTILTLGSPNKRCMPCETNTKLIARKSIFARETIEAGQKFSRENIAILRPEQGQKPKQFWELIGSMSSQKYNKGDVIGEQ